MMGQFGDVFEFGDEGKLVKEPSPKDFPLRVMPLVQEPFHPECESFPSTYVDAAQKPVPLTVLEDSLQGGAGSCQEEHHPPNTPVQPPAEPSQVVPNSAEVHPATVHEPNNKDDKQGSCTKRPHSKGSANTPVTAAAPTIYEDGSYWKILFEMCMHAGHINPMFACFVYVLQQH